MDDMAQWARGPDASVMQSRERLPFSLASVFIIYTGRPSGRAMPRPYERLRFTATHRLCGRVRATDEATEDDDPAYLP